LVLYLYEKEIVLEDNQEAPAEKPEAKKDKPKNGNGDEPAMTDAQKRYLFRILAERGIDGDKAYSRLKEIFQVDALKEITKMEASRAIERLLSEGKGASDGIPF
jgi:hypothetical protein